MNVGEIRAEAGRRFLARCVTDLYRYYDAARSCLAKTQLPIPAPPEVAAARAKANEALTKARKTKEAANKANVRWEGIKSREPTGLIRIYTWITGDLRRYRKVLAKAEARARRADEWRVITEKIAHGFSFAVEVEIERAKSRRAQEVEHRSQMAEEAMLAMDRAKIAVAMLKRDPTLVAFSANELLKRAEEERCRRERIQRDQDILAAARQGGHPRMH